MGERVSPDETLKGLQTDDSNSVELQGPNTSGRAAVVQEDCSRTRTQASKPLTNPSGGAAVPEQESQRANLVHRIPRFFTFQSHALLLRVHACLRRRTGAGVHTQIDCKRQLHLPGVKHDCKE